MTPVTEDGATPPRQPAQSQSRRTQRPRPRPRASTAPPSPNRTINPGREHVALSGAILRAAQRKASAHGIELDVGVIPTYTGLDPTADDPERPARILAHAIARTADRFPLLRKVSRQVEGTDAKAGLGADIAASMYELCVRNQEQIEQMLRGYVSNAAARRAARAANGGSETGRFRKTHKQEVPQ